MTTAPTELPFGINLSDPRLFERAEAHEAFRRLPDIQLAGEPERLRSNFINGTKHLPVTYTPAR